MRSTAIILFENQKSNWNRYPKLIAQNSKNVDTIYVYNHKDTRDDPTPFTFHFRYTGDMKPLMEKLKFYNKLILVQFSFRPIDLFFLTNIKKLVPSCKTINIQHGIYSDKLERSSLTSFFINTNKRLLSYITTFIFSKCNFSFSERINLIYESFLVFVLNKKRFKSSGLKNILILPDRCLIFGNKWIEFYRENYYDQNFSNFNIIPPKDYELLSGEKIIDLNAVVLIAQSLVEDGRYPRKDLIKELELILTCIPIKKKIYIKRHPRSEDSIYESLSRDVILTNKLVISNHIISCYSSLMHLYSEMINSNVFCWKLKNHHNPDIFNDFSTIYGREKELRKFFLEPTKDVKTDFEKKNIGKTYFNEIIK